MRRDPSDNNLEDYYVPHVGGFPFKIPFQIRPGGGSDQSPDAEGLQDQPRMPPLGTKPPRANTDIANEGHRRDWGQKLSFPHSSSVPHVKAG